MARYRQALPQLGGEFFLTDGGIETTLIFLEGLDLPDFAAFTQLKTREGQAALQRYFHGYASLAQQFGTGLILESATWRASADWGARLAYDVKDIETANRKAIGLLEDIQREFRGDVKKIVISGCLGPRADGYTPGKTMSEEEAQAYHDRQVRVFADSAADMVSAMTMNYVEEAIGITRAAERAGMPIAVSFTVETDGRLPTGQTLRAAMEQVDAVTSGYPAYYMINCAHPTHFEHVLPEGQAWTQRIRGLRTNASSRSHAELNESPELDPGDPAELGREHAELKRRLPQINVMGGCCGTDIRHVARIAEACAPLFDRR